MSTRGEGALSARGTVALRDRSRLDNTFAHALFGLSVDGLRRFLRHVWGAWFILFDSQSERWKAHRQFTGSVTIRGEEGGTIDAREKP